MRRSSSSSSSPATSTVSSTSRAAPRTALRRSVPRCNACCRSLASRVSRAMLFVHTPSPVVSRAPSPPRAETASPCVRTGTRAHHMTRDAITIQAHARSCRPLCRESNHRPVSQVTIARPASDSGDRRSSPRLRHALMPSAPRARVCARARVATTLCRAPAAAVFAFSFLVSRFSFRERSAVLEEARRAARAGLLLRARDVRAAAGRGVARDRRAAVRPVTCAGYTCLSSEWRHVYSGQPVKHICVISHVPRPRADARRRGRRDDARHPGVGPDRSALAALELPRLGRERRGRLLLPLPVPHAHPQAGRRDLAGRRGSAARGGGGCVAPVAVVVAPRATVCRQGEERRSASCPSAARPRCRARGARFFLAPPRLVVVSRSFARARR